MDGKTCVVIPARPTDLDAVMALLAPYMENNLLLKRSGEQVADLLQTGFVARDGGQVIGFAAVEIYSSKLAEIQCLAVDSDWQQRGVGTHMYLSPEAHEHNKHTVLVFQTQTPCGRVPNTDI